MLDPTSGWLWVRDAGCLKVSEPTSRTPWVRGAGCIISVGTYLWGTVGHGCKLFKQYQNLPPRHFVAGVKAVLAMSDPTSRALLGRLFKRCQHLLPRHRETGLQAGCLGGLRTHLQPLWDRDAG